MTRTQPTSTDRPPDRLSTALWEADRHTLALSAAVHDWLAADVVSLERIEQDSALMRLADQLVFRFTKLQDAMGERLMPATLAYLAEPYEDRPMRDRLNRLEKLGYLDLRDWLHWRDLRNQLAHEYPDQAEQRLQTLQATVTAATHLMATYRAWLQKLKKDTSI